MRYNTNGEKRKLSFIERNMAYGVETERASLGQSNYRVNIVSLKSRTFDVSVDKKGRPRAIMTIDGRRARLQFVYLTVDDSGLFPDVRFIDIYGQELATGRPVHERYRP